MKIALITFEYPPDTGIGGIGTYMSQLSSLLTERGHVVEVFAASFEKTYSISQLDGITINRVKSIDKHLFKDEILPVFSKRHAEMSFDIIESPEYMADGIQIKRCYPEIPLVVKLHTPDFWIKEISGLNPSIPSVLKRYRFVLGAYRRLKTPQPYWWQYIKEQDVEYHITRMANLVLTPSVSMGEIVSKKWNIPKERIKHIPNPFFLSQSYLKTPIKNSAPMIGFFGRLEVRKGVAIFVKVIPKVLKECPDAIFRFVGMDQSYSIKQMTMKEFILDQLKPYHSNIRFVNHVSHDEIPLYLADTAICVFPSVWENFPNVCLEAMSAGRAVVASNKGGMVDMLRSPKAGILVDPSSAEGIAKAIIKLLKNSDLRLQLGRRARESVLRKYNNEVIGNQIEKVYNKLIKSLPKIK